MSQPASTGRFTPVMLRAASDARKHTASAISSGVTMRPKALVASSSEGSRSPASMAAPSAGVRVKPGETAFTRTPERPHSAARLCVMAITAALAGA